MSVYKVPFDFTHEEKVFGGYLSLRQMLYLILSVISVGVLFIRISMTLKIIIYCFIVATLMIFAFLKIGNIYADKYFLNIVKYMFRRKRFIFER